MEINIHFKYAYIISANCYLLIYFLQVAPNVSEVFESCSWRGDTVDCTYIFKIVLTAEGVCFNFNALAASEMFTDR